MSTLERHTEDSVRHVSPGVGQESTGTRSHPGPLLNNLGGPASGAASFVDVGPPPLAAASLSPCLWLSAFPSPPNLLVRTPSRSAAPSLSLSPLSLLGSLTLPPPRRSLDDGGALPSGRVWDFTPDTYRVLSMHGLVSSSQVLLAGRVYHLRPFLPLPCS